MIATAGIPGRGSFTRGVHPPHRKHLAADAPVEVMPTPPKVAVPLLQHTGAPCEPVVKARQEVALGEVIGKAAGFISAGVHAPLAGEVGRESVATLPNGRHVKIIPITAGEDQLIGQALWNDLYGGEWPTNGLDRYDGKDIVEVKCATHVPVKLPSNRRAVIQLPHEAIEKENEPSLPLLIRHITRTRNRVL